MSAVIASLMAVELPDDQRVALAHRTRGADVADGDGTFAACGGGSWRYTWFFVSRGGTPPVPQYPTRYVSLYMYTINNICIIGMY